MEDNLCVAGPNWLTVHPQHLHRFHTRPSESFVCPGNWIVAAGDIVHIFQFYMSRSLTEFAKEMLPQLPPLNFPMHKSAGGEQRQNFIEWLTCKMSWGHLSCPGTAYMLPSRLPLKVDMYTETGNGTRLTCRSCLTQMAKFRVSMPKFRGWPKNFFQCNSTLVQRMVGPSDQDICLTGNHFTLNGLSVRVLIGSD